MLRGLRILIADQHVGIRTWMRELLSVIGATSVSMAANASEMMRMARNLTFDIVICDHHLDDKRDGQQLLEELRFLHILPLRSVFMIATAERKYNHVVAAAEFAPDDYLVKPYTPGQLSNRLERALHKKTALAHVFDHLEVCDHESALHACDRVMRLSPRYTLDALRIKAESLVALARIDEASALYQSIATTRAVPWARMGYAMMLQRQKRLDEAKDEATLLNDEYPEFLSVYDLLARIHEEAGELAKAIEYLERASAITSSSNTDRLRHIADIAEVAGDRPKVISTLRRVVERTQRSSLLKVDDYLALTRNLLDEERVDEAAAIADDMRHETRKAQSGELASEVVTAMVQRGKGRLADARSALDRALALFDAEQAAASDLMAVEIAEESVQHGDIGRAAAIMARMSGKEALPDKIKSRLDSWLQSETEGTPGDGDAQRAFGERMMEALADAIVVLEGNWSPDNAEKTRQLLIDAFTLMPRDKRVIQAHIRYNSIAVKHGGERHSPTIRDQS